MYKVGDKVRVRTDLEVGKNGTIIMMKASEGKEFTVSGVQDWGFFRTYDLDGDEYGFFWKECLLEPVEEKSEIEKINDHVREITIIAQDQRIRYLEERLEELKKQLAEQLLPCPFCGNTTAPKVMTASEIDDDLDKDDLAVCCRATQGGCGATGGYERTRKDAIENWNRRV